MSESFRRHFTLAQANATLPLVRRIVGDLQQLHPRWRQAVSAYEAEQVGASAQVESEAARTARLEAGSLAGEIESCLDELDQIGCLFKGFDAGLVDYPALIGDREVFLCWRFGEEQVEYWHEIDGGFAGRQPVDPALFEVTTS
jgi:hypothetical protein